MKDKIKLMKGSSKEWHWRHSQNMEGKIREVKERMSSLDTKGETSDLLEEETVELHDLSLNLHSVTCSD